MAKGNKRSRAKDAARAMLPPSPSSAKDLERYNPTSLQGENEAKLLDQYKHMRDAIRKRQERMAKAGRDLPPLYKKGMALFPPVSKLKDSRELRFRLSDAARFLASKETSVSELKKSEQKAIKTLQDAGYNITTQAQLKAFGKFMEVAREQYGKNLMGMPSDQVAAAFDPEDVLSADGLQDNSTLRNAMAELFFKDDYPFGDDFDEDF